MRSLILVVLLAAVCVVGCDSTHATMPVGESEYSDITNPVRHPLPPSGAVDQQIILVNGINDYTNAVVNYTGAGPVVTDNGDAVAATLIVTDGFFSNLRDYTYDSYGNVTNCYDGAAIELLNPNSNLLIIGQPGDTIYGDMRGIDVRGHIEITGGITVIGRQDCGIELRPYATAGVLECNITAKGDSGYYGCNAGVGGSAIYANNNNGFVPVKGDIYARWDYAAKAGVNSAIEIDGNVFYFGPRTAFSGNVVVSGALTDLSVPQKPGQRKGHYKH